MKRSSVIAIVVVAVVAAVGTGLWLNTRGTPTTTGTQKKPLRVAMAPYQDMAMLVNHDHLQLGEKHGVEVELVTTAWEDLLPAVASAGPTVDVAFAGLLEYLNKYEQMNAGSADPVLYVFPTYVFKGGAFVTFQDDVPVLAGQGQTGREDVEAFFDLKIGAQKFSALHMMLYDVAQQYKIPFEEVEIVDVPLSDGLLAAQAESLDVTGTGLTQRTEALRRGGRVVLDNDIAGFADVTGFVVRQSTLRQRRSDIEALIRVWFDCVDYVMGDLDSRSGPMISYLKETSSTEYDTTTLRQALSHEYFPRTIEEAQTQLVEASGSYSVPRIANRVGAFLVDTGLVQTAPPIPQLIDLADSQ